MYMAETWKNSEGEAKGRREMWGQGGRETGEVLERGRTETGEGWD